MTSSRHRTRGYVLAAVAVVVAAGCSSNGPPTRVKAASPTPSGTPTAAGSAAPATNSAPAEALQQAYVSVVAKVRPQVVEIATSSGLGSGVVYDNKGDIVTNAHVVGSATTFSVVVSTGQQLSANLIGTYPPDDLAVIRVNNAKGLTPAAFGDSSAAQVGDIVFAVGNPLGLASSVTDGIVSYNGRAVSEGSGVTLQSTVQTSAAINPGNSGGALANLAGQVIGIPTLAAANQQEGGVAAGIGFAIPSNTVKLIVPQLIDNGKVTNSGRAGLGIQAADATDAAGNPAGVLVVRTTPGGAAAKAGINPGDVITAVNGTNVTSLADLQAALAGLTPGATATLSVTDQNGNSRTANVTLGQL